MRQFSMLLSVVVVVLLGSAGMLSRLPAAAQEATPTGMAHHPVVGLWRFTNEVETPPSPPSASSTPTGTYIEDYPDESSFSLGLWRPTGERSAEVTVYQN